MTCVHNTTNTGQNILKSDMAPFHVRRPKIPTRFKYQQKDPIHKSQKLKDTSPSEFLGKAYYSTSIVPKESIYRIVRALNATIYKTVVFTCTLSKYYYVITPLGYFLCITR